MFAIDCPGILAIKFGHWAGLRKEFESEGFSDGGWASFSPHGVGDDFHVTTPQIGLWVGLAFLLVPLVALLKPLPQLHLGHRAFSIAVAVIVAATAKGSHVASAFGRDDKWGSGWGQGVAEAIVTHGPGNHIYVTCNEGGGAGSTGISFMLAGKAPTGDNITLTFDKDDPEQIWISNGEITSNCRACTGNYEYTIRKLRSYKSVHVLFENGDNARFTLQGANEAITDCVPDFAR